MCTEKERFRIYAGYAGWAPKQLESECNKGHWHILKADTETLFDKKSSEIRQELIQRVSVKWVRTINSGNLLEKSYPRNPALRKIIKRNWDRTKVKYRQLKLELKSETVFRP